MWLQVIGVTICVLAILNVVVDDAGADAWVWLIVGVALFGISYLQKIAANR